MIDLQTRLAALEALRSLGKRYGMYRAEYLRAYVLHDALGDLLHMLSMPLRQEDLERVRRVLQALHDEVDDAISRRDPSSY